MLIPIDRLDADTLRRVIEEYVTRDGTELSDVDAKVRQVQRELQAGRAELHFDEESETTEIVRVDRPGRSGAGRAEGEGDADA